ncbi:MAG: SUMF1/EgtB/PvdO family nonheme iron enzyme [Planctomycetota bacterium]
MPCKPVLQTTMLCGSLTLLMTSGCGEEGTPSPIDEPNEIDTPSAESAEDQPKAPDTARAAPPAADLPASFTDSVQGYHQKQVPFEMILIPGDEAKGIKPFYIGKTEVSRAMFLRWAYGDDVEDAFELAKLIEKGLRPSPIYSEHVALHVARGKGDWLAYPAIGMSHLTARSYCLWLSEKTGKRYRLPNDVEWLHALELSGGVPNDREALLRQAMLEDNTEWTIDGFFPEPRRVAEGEPNRLGLVNLLGNATEWVESDAEDRWVRGGHFGLKADDLTETWKAIEDQSVWNETYPQLPYSRFWYLDFYYTGLRLVCEVESVEPE